MAIFDGGDVYTALGARPAVNAAGAGTMFGGSAPSPRVMQAMLDANRSYVDMPELLERSGEYVAKLVGTEAAYITSGCAAALTLSVAACMAGTDPEKIEQLPKTTGMPHELLIQKGHRYGFDRMLTIPGAELVEVGDGETWTSDGLDRAIGDDTAAVFYLFPPNWDRPLAPLEETVEVAHSHGVPVIVDAAATIYPTDHLRSVAQAADLVCFGGKYFQAPHATGFVCGRKDLVHAVAANGFAGIGNNVSGLGRPMKLDRQAIIACVAALDDWFTTNHEDRLERCDRVLGHIRDSLNGIPGVRTEMFDEKLFTGPRLGVHVDAELTGKDASQVHAELLDGEPKIFTGTPEHLGVVLMDANTLNDGEERIVADRLLEVLTA